MRRARSGTEGTVRRLRLHSAVLENNLLGDPADRIVDVYVPGGHSGEGLPLLVDLVGYTGGGPAHTNWKNFGENVPERLDRLIGAGTMPPAVVAFPDCFTRLGGNQYINSAAMGAWADFLLEEAVPYIERELHCGGSGRRGVFGKSSGGYGAVVHALLYPDFWAAAACHSGDMGFETVYLPHLVRMLPVLAKAGGIRAWLEEFFAKPKARDEDIHHLEMLGMCASYDPDPHAYLGIRLPLDPDTAELIPERWANFAKWDPLNVVETKGAGLVRLKALYIDCGDVDQFNLVYGARRLVRSLRRQQVAHRYEEFPDDHSNIDYRMDVSLPFLAAALSG
ncbi:MAG TPA: alpha/beta hydrolase-fold protein [Steroidobacteraceae bacterium]